MKQWISAAISIPWAGTSMKRTVMMMFLLLTVLMTSPAIAQIPTEHPVATQVYAPVHGFFGIAIASDGDQFLAAWVDARGNDAVYATRIDRDGTVLDPNGIFIATGGYGAPVGVAWNADSYVVMWASADGMMAARVAKDGQIAVPPRLILKGTYYPKQIAANGNVIIVPAGRTFVLDHELRIINSALFGGSFISVYPTGLDEFTLVQDASTSYCCRTIRLDSTGHLASEGIQTGFQQGGAISCHGLNCVWAFDNPISQQINVAPFDPIAQTRGTPLDLPIADRDSQGRISTFTLVAIAHGYLLVTNANTMQRLDLQGIPTGPPTSLCCSLLDNVAAASNGRDAAVLRSSSILTVAVTTPSTDGEPRVAASSATAQHHIAITGSGTNYLVAWTEADGVYAGRLTRDGTILDGRGQLLRRGGGSTFSQPSVFNNQPPVPAASITFDGASYIAAVSSDYNPLWEPGRQASISLMRIDPASGEALSTTTICGNDMRVASNGHSTIGAWIDCAGGLDISFLDGNGAPASVPVTVATSSPPNAPYFGVPFVANPSLAWNGTEWLITWEKQAIGCYNCPIDTFLEAEAVYAARLSPALTLLDTKPISVAAYLSIRSSHVASDGHDFLITWYDDGGTHVRGVSASGTPLADQVISPAFVQDLAWDGSAYSLALSARRSYDAPADLALLRFPPSGKPIASLTISATPDDERSAALLSLGGGRVLAAYTRVAHEYPYTGVERAFVVTPHFVRGRAARTPAP